MMTPPVPTFIANIYVGLDAGDKVYTYEDAKKLIQNYANTVGLCVTVTQTEYVYNGGSEPGIIVGLINYPRFPKNPDELKVQALNLADLLRKGLGQLKVTVVMLDETIMIGESKTMNPRRPQT